MAINSALISHDVYICIYYA